MPRASLETIRSWVDEKTPQRPKISTTIDLPLSNSSKTILKAAADEADRMGHLHIGTEHLFLGLFAVKDCLATELMQRAGTNPESVRAKISKQSRRCSGIAPKTIQVRPKTSSGSVDRDSRSKTKCRDIRDVV